MAQTSHDSVWTVSTMWEEEGGMCLGCLAGEEVKIRIGSSPERGICLDDTLTLTHTPTHTHPSPS